MGGRKRMNEGGGPKRRMQIDMTQIAREREEEEAESETSSKSEKKGANNPLLSLLGGEYEDDDTSKLGNLPAKSGSTTSDDVSDPAIDKQLDNFLMELGQITGDTKKGETQKEEVKEVAKEVEGAEVKEKAKESGGGTQTAWQACLDAESNEYYYWNTVTDEVTWDMPEELQKLQQQQTDTTTKQTSIEAQKESVNESESAGSRVKREVGEVEEGGTESVAKRVKIDTEEGKAVPEAKSPIPSSKDNDEITTLLEQHHSEMLKEDTQQAKADDKPAKLQIELESSILAISGKFKTFDVETTQALDDAMDSMDIDPEILLERKELTKLKIEFETRVADWREGALNATYLQSKLLILASILEKTKLKPTNFETWNLLPVGWTRLADPSGSGTYFANVITNETSWIWPPETQPPPTSSTPTTPPSSSSSATITSPPVSSPPPLSTPPTSTSTSSTTIPTTIYSSAPVRYTSGEVTTDSLSSSLSRSPSPPPPPPPDDVPPPPPPPPSSDPSTPLPPAGKKKVKTAASVAKPAKMNSVFAKWASARSEIVGKQQTKEEEEEEEEDLETVEQKKRVEIEQWRVEQIKTGESDSNANFVPVAMDWRERVERARRIAAKDKPKE